MTYKIEVKNRESGEWELKCEGEASSRRKFIKDCGGSHKIKEVVKDRGRTYHVYKMSTTSGIIKELYKQQYRIIKK